MAGRGWYNQRLDFRRQLPQETAFEIGAGLRLADRVVCSQHQCSDFRFRAALRQLPEHDQGQPRMALAQSHERLQAAQVSQLHIEHQYVDAAVVQLGQCDPSGRSGPDDLEFLIALQQTADRQSLDRGTTAIRNRKRFMSRVRRFCGRLRDDGFERLAGVQKQQEPFGKGKGSAKKTPPLAWRRVGRRKQPLRRDL
jgi:hypothetical protein